MNVPPPSTVLIVEDDEGVARLQQRRLERAGFTVAAVQTTAAARERLQTGGIDLMVLDKQLSPTEDGLEFYTALKAEGFSLPVILVTGYSDDATIINALRAGVRDYVFKSVEYLDYLPEAVSRVLEQVRVQRELARSQARLSAVVQTALDGIVTVDGNHRVTMFNPAAERIFGCSAADVIGLACCDRFLPDGLPTQSEVGGVVEVNGRRTDGVVVPLEISRSQFELAGEMLCTLIVRDVTERKRADNALRAKTDELKAITQQLWQAAKLASVGELAASLAHELNNPLATVSLRVEGVLAKTSADDPRRRPLEVVEQEVGRMARLVANLLQFSRPTRDEASTVDVCAELTRTSELVEPYLKRRNVSLAPEFAPGVPDIYADRQRLRQVFLNLFTNAADAMPHGGRLTARVSRSTLPPNKPAIAIEIADTGVGIPAEHLPRVTEAFFTTKEDGKGTGLGLPICRRIVHDHQGTLEIDSTVGVGTNVRITLPVTVNANTARLNPA